MEKISQKNNSKLFYAISFAWQLGFLIAIPINGATYLGKGDIILKKNNLEKERVPISNGQCYLKKDNINIFI